MKSSVLLFAAATLLAACATPVAPEAAAPQQLADAGTTASPDAVCRKIEVTGTRFPKKECRTADEWREFDKATADSAKEQTDKIQRLNSGGASQAGG